MENIFPRKAAVDSVFIYLQKGMKITLVKQFTNRQTLQNSVYNNIIILLYNNIIIHAMLITTSYYYLMITRTKSYECETVTLQ